LVHAVSHHGRWSLRREVRSALLGNDKTPLGRALEFARSLPPTIVRQVLRGSRLPENVKKYLLLQVEQCRPPAVPRTARSVGNGSGREPDLTQGAENCAPQSITAWSNAHSGC
jgi:hypothetical protein